MSPYSAFLLFYLVFLCCHQERFVVQGWTEQSPGSAIDRRVAFGRIASLATGSLLSSGFETEAVSAAEVDGSISSNTFSTYNIIPDQSAALDPRLVKVDNKKFVSEIASGGSGGSIWLGEHHNSQKDHAFQAEFIRKVHTERSRRKIREPLAVGLEQVQNQFQPVLDDYIAGKIGIEEMKNMVEWDKRWMWDFEGYRPVFETAKDLNIRLLALNVDSEDLAKVEKGGYPGLPVERLRKYIKDPVGFGEFAKAQQFNTYVNYVISPSYEIHQRLGLLRYTIAGEKLDEEMPFRNFLSGRILWDEGMASAAYSWASENPGGLMIGLVGADHVKFRNGIPARFSRMARDKFGCTTVVINPTLIDSRPSGSVANVPGSDSPQTPDRITLQLRYLKDGVDPTSEERKLPESTGGVLPFSNYIVIT